MCHKWPESASYYCTFPLPQYFVHSIIADMFGVTASQLTTITPFSDVLLRGSSWIVMFVPEDVPLIRKRHLTEA
jgi:hypothetical protein